MLLSGCCICIKCVSHVRLLNIHCKDFTHWLIGCKHKFWNEAAMSEFSYVVIIYVKNINFASFGVIIWCGGRSSNDFLF